VKVLIVHAHEEPRSFNAAMKDLAVETLQSVGHEVKVSDLYAMGFKAVADTTDFLERRDAFSLKRQKEEMAAAELGTLAHDILTEQKKIQDCELLILQFPLWWFSMPAILKGWVDRVMTLGFAYGGGQWYDNGGLKGRQAMLAITTGGPDITYAQRGINGAMARVLFPIQHGILFFCGFQVLPPFIVYGPAHLADEQRHSMLQAYRARLIQLPMLEPIPFHPIDHYDDGMQLKPEFSLEVKP